MLASESGQLEVVTMLLAKLDTRVNTFHSDSANDGLAPPPERDSFTDVCPDSSDDTSGSSDTDSSDDASGSSSALHLAYRKRHKGIVRLLLGSPHVDVNAVDVSITCTFSSFLATRVSAAKTLQLPQVMAASGHAATTLTAVNQNLHAAIM